MASSNLNSLCSLKTEHTKGDNELIKRVKKKRTYIISTLDNKTPAITGKEGHHQGQAVDFKTLGRKMKTAIPPLDQGRRKEIIFSFLDFSFPLLVGNALIQHSNFLVSVEVIQASIFCQNFLFFILSFLSC